MSTEDIFIGIDLGTTNSCAAVYLNGTIRILDNKEGERLTPSYLYYTTNNAVIVGKYARRMTDTKQEYGIYEVKRLIGRKFDDPKVQNNLQYLSYNIENVDNEPVICIEQPKTTIRKSPVESCTAILAKIKIDVENKLGKGQGNKAVITVPAYFNIAQRQSTLEAATAAGFTVLKLLNEPTAAAFRFYLENECSINDYILVYDLCGGTFDVAIFKKTKNNVKIVGVDGDSHLGEHDFDNLILDYVSNILMEKYKINPKSNNRLLRRLRNECEEAKKALSDLDNTEIILEGFSGVDQIKIDITKPEFEDMTDFLFEKTIEIVDKCLKSCNLSKEKIKKVILAGGSTRIPKIQEVVENYFGEGKISKFLHPDECVGEGAAIQAAMLSINPKQKLDVLKITDVTPLSLGTDADVHLMKFYIRRNTPIPASATSSWVTAINQQERMFFNIYEGERTDTRKNRHLGQIILENLTPAPPSQCKVSVTMEIDHNGILKVTSKEKNKDNIKDLKVVYSRGHASDAEVKNALKDAEDNKEEDNSFVKFAKLKKYLLDYCEAVNYNVEKKKLVDREIYDLCVKSCEEGENLEMGDEARVKSLIDLVESKCIVYVRQYKFEFMPKFAI